MRRGPPKKKKKRKKPLFFRPGREEEASLRDKIRADHERALQEAKEKLRKSREELQAEIQTEKTRVAQELKKKEEAGPKPLPPVPMPRVVGASDGEPPEPDAKEKRDKIREVRWRWSAERAECVPECVPAYYQRRFNPRSCVKL